MTATDHRAPGGDEPGSSSEPAGATGPDLTSPGAAGRSEPGVAPPPDTNQARAEPVADSDAPDDPSTLDTTGTIGTADPQSPGAARLAAEPALSSTPGTPAVSGQQPGVGHPQGVLVPAEDPAPGTSEELTGVGEVSSVTPLAEPGHQVAGTGSQPMSGARRPQAPDAEVSPR